MSNLINNSINNALAALTRRAPQGVMNAISQASAKTGVDFAYLVQQAAAESSFKADAKAATSSASGLYQFIESTWMNMVDKYGAKHGISTDGMSRAEVLALRNDPQKASVMAAEFASENERFLRSHYEGEIGATELYFAHFLGAGSAASFLNARAENGLKEAALLFPKAAKANPSIFYDQKTGRSKTLDEVYAYFDKKFEIEDKVKRETTIEMAAESYQNPFGDYPDKAERHAPTRPARIEAEVARMSGAHYNLPANPIELIMLTQMMDLPISRKDSDFELYSARSILK